MIKFNSWDNFGKTFFGNLYHVYSNLHHFLGSLAIGHVNLWGQGPIILAFSYPFEINKFLKSLINLNPIGLPDNTNIKYPS